MQRFSDSRLLRQRLLQYTMSLSNELLLFTTFRQMPNLDTFKQVYPRYIYSSDVEIHPPPLSNLETVTTRVRKTVAGIWKRPGCLAIFCLTTLCHNEDD